MVSSLIQLSVLKLKIDIALCATIDFKWWNDIADVVEIVLTYLLTLPIYIIYI
jgi:hypothetical protein